MKISKNLKNSILKKFEDKKPWNFSFNFGLWCYLKLLKRLFHEMATFFGSETGIGASWTRLRPCALMNLLFLKSAFFCLSCVKQSPKPVKANKRVNTLLDTRGEGLGNSHDSLLGFLKKFPKKKYSTPSHGRFITAKSDLKNHAISRETHPAGLRIRDFAVTSWYVTCDMWWVM